VADAQKVQQQVLEMKRQVLGAEHPQTLKAMQHLVPILFTRGDLALARNVQEQVVAACRGALGDRHPDTQAAMAALAQIKSFALGRKLRRIFVRHG